MTRTDNAWVRPGDGVSVSIGVNFYTRCTRRRAYVHAANVVLRRLGLNPRHPGKSGGLDGVKYPFGRATIWARKALRGYVPTRSF
jgi:hypothetical protein